MNLRPMTMEDADRMLEWKNYPETRRFAIATHAEIKREDHLKFLEKNLQYFFVIEDRFDVYGAIRIKDNEISIWLDRKARGKGIATWAIKSVSKPGMTAKILVQNIASMRAFVKAGYIPIEYVPGKYEDILGDNSYLIFKCTT